jgi:hypothetical protein
MKGVIEMESTRCSICGRKLTNAESIARGVGPVCYKRCGLPSQKGDFRRQQMITQYMDKSSRYSME